MNELIQDVEQWGKEKGILDKATPQTQWDKMNEEVYELIDSYNAVMNGEENLGQEMSEAGDVMVTLILYCKIRGYSLKDCLQIAYDKISKRSGNMIKGTFVKDHY